MSDCIADKLADRIEKIKATSHTKPEIVKIREESIPKLVSLFRELSAINKSKSVETKDENVVTEKSKADLTKEELQDVAGLASMLGVTNKKDPEHSGTLEEIMSSQKEIVKMLEKGDVDKATLSNVLSWLNTDGVELTKERKERATYKTFDHKTKEPLDAETIEKNKKKFEERSKGNTELYLLTQLLEELGELLDTKVPEGDVRVKELLEVQKRALKVMRFGENTVIKGEGPYSGLTNKEALEEANKQASLGTGLSVIDTINKTIDEVILEITPPWEDTIKNSSSSSAGSNTGNKKPLTGIEQKVYDKAYSVLENDIEPDYQIIAKDLAKEFNVDKDKALEIVKSVSTAAFQMKGTEIKNDSPELFQVIMDNLKATYPNINVKAVDKIIGTDGLPALGRALKGIVEYVPTEAGLDTLPHEYSHIYVDILEGTPLVESILTQLEKSKKLSRKDAKEYLVDAMGKNYVSYMKGDKKIVEEKGKEKISLAKYIWKVVKKYLGIGPSAKELAYEIDLLSRYFYEGVDNDAIRFSPKEGYELVNTEATFEDQPLAAEILNFIVKESSDNSATFTGSAALALQGSVYRKGKNGITDLHDLDMEVLASDVNKLRELLKKEYNGILIYNFPTIKNKELSEVLSHLEKNIKKDSTYALLLGIGSFILKRNKVNTLIVPPKGLTVKDIKRYGGKSYGRVESYSLVDSEGNIKGTYKADISPVPNSKRTQIDKEYFVGEKAVIVDLLGNATLDDRIKYYSKYLKSYINIKKAEGIFEAKNMMGGFKPREKDVMDRIFFSPTVNVVNDIIASIPTNINKVKDCK